MSIVLAVPGNVAPKGIHLEIQAAFAVENLALGYLSAALQTAGKDCKIIDGYWHRCSPMETAERIASVKSIDWVGISVLQSTARAAQETTRALRASGYNGPIIMGGWAAMLAPRLLMEFIPEADYLFTGEGDVVVVKFALALQQRSAMDSIPGLWRRRGSQILPPLSNLEPTDLGSATIPHHYLYEECNSGEGLPPMPILGSRGCQWGRCSFCSTGGVYGYGQWRARHASSLFQEMQWANRTHGIRDFFFIDDSFFGPTTKGFDRAWELVGILKKSHLDVSFALDCRVPDYHRDLFMALRQVGLQRVFLGIESGSDAVLCRFRKGFSTEEAHRVLDELHNLGIEVIPGFIMFEPYMTLVDVRATVDFMARHVRQWDPTKLVKRVVPEYGTLLHKQLELDGLLRGKYPDLDYWFIDPAVGRLYKRLCHNVEPIIIRYSALCALKRLTPGFNHEMTTLKREALEVFARCYGNITDSTDGEERK